MRTCGILMPVSSLPGPFGIGTLGKSAYAFVDFLKKARQSVWQILPLSPTGFGDSPYQSCSAFAGNPYFIDLALLQKDGLLKKSEYANISWGETDSRVDYAALYHKRFAVLRKAFERFSVWYPDEYYHFCYENNFWLEDYALYMTIKQDHQLKCYRDWPADLRAHKKEALDTIYATREKEVHFWKFLQFVFFRQWKALKEYANEQGIRIMGDIPIYVAEDSADVWAGGKLFELDEEGAPVRVAGCPPDYFSADGQLWGNPLYNWPYHRETGYAWWTRRVQYALGLYDILRIDHFRAFDTYYAIPAGAENARGGQWCEGPGIELFQAVEKQLGKCPIVAEDLGEMFDSVRVLLAKTGFPGMKVMQFAFDCEQSEYLPHNCPPNSVVYPGTHDNATLRGWLAKASKASVRRAEQYLGLNRQEGYAEGMLRGVLGCPSDLAVVYLPDWLGLGDEARLNTPSTLSSKNWTWRAEKSQLSAVQAKAIRTMCARYGRA